MKRQNFPVPDEIDPPRICIQLQWPDTQQHREILMGLLLEPSYWFNWQRDDEKRGKDVAAVYKDVLNSLEWGCMSGCCPDQIVLHRVTAEGQAQISTDGGVTWVQDPDDPRINVPSVPPVIVPDGIDPRCQSAQNEADQFQAAQIAFGAGLDFEAGVLAVAGAICAICAAILLDPAHLTTLIPLIIHEAGALLHETNEEYNGQFGDTEYGQLRCIFFEHAEEDGTYTDADYTAIKAAIEDKFGDRIIVRNTFLIILALSGTLGLNFFSTLTTNAVEVDECAGCDACETTWAIGGADHGTINNPDTYQTDGFIDVTSGPALSGHYYVILHTPTDFECCTLDKIVVVEGDGADFYGWDTCGQTYTEGDPHQTGLLPGGASLRSLLTRGSASYRIKIFWTP